MTAPRWTKVVSLLVLLSSHAGAVERPELATLPLPNLSAMEDATRQRLELLQDRVSELQLSGSDGGLAEAYGTLGMYYIAHHLNDAAEVALRNAALLSPSDFRWAYYLGFVYQMVGDLERERGAFERALELRPEDIPTHLHLAELLLALGEDEAAYGGFQRALELSPSEAAAHGGLGRAAAALGRPEEAVGHLTKALELQPRATIVHYQLALAYRKLGDTEAARAQMEQRGTTEIGYADPLLSAIEPLKKENVVEVVLEMATEPEDHDDRSVAIFAATHLRNLPQAIDQIHEAIVDLTPAAGALDPSSEEAARNRLVRARLHLALASLRLDRSDYGGARNQLDAALALVPEMVTANMMLGYVLENTGAIEAAVECYSAVLEIEPGNTDALRSRANAMVDLHHDREAIEDLERLCELGLEGDGARIRLAVAHLRLGELDKAREHYGKSLELNLDPSDAAQVHHHLGVIESRSGSPDRAVEEYRTALALDPNLVAASLDLGVALGLLGRHQESAETYRGIVDVDPGNIRARLGEAEALAALGRSREARQRLEEGWQSIPESVELLHALARILASADDPEVRDGERALDLAQRNLRAGTTPNRLETLAMANAEAGLFDEAVRLQRRVIQMMIWEGHTDALPRLEANLTRYLSGQTCCADAPSSE
jgi:tetratricopeptide (TPR) repeat protein